MPPLHRSISLSLVPILAWGCADPDYGTSGSGGDPGATATSGTGGASATSTGGDTVTTSTGPTSTCGDWIVEPNEACEDGNALSGDGCSADCALEATCGNGVVEPGEACDDAHCDAATCTPTQTSVCFGGAPLHWGTNAMLAAGSNAGFEVAAGCPAALRSVGYLDTGPLPWRVALSPIGADHNFLARAGCGEPVSACRSRDVTATLPPHTIVSLGAGVSATTGMGALVLQRVRFGSFFHEPDGFTSEGAGMNPSWTHDGTLTTWSIQAAAPADATLRSPDIDLRGLEAPIVLHFLHEVAALAAGAEARVEVQLDDGPFVPLVTYTTTFTEEELEIPGAADHDTLRVRFVLDHTTTSGASKWVVQNFFVGPPFAP